MKWQCIVFHFLLALTLIKSITHAESPPLAVFTFSDTSYSDAKKQYGLACKNNTIPQDGIQTVTFQNSKTENIFSFDGQTPHNEFINIKCKTNEGYYESLLANDSFTMKCENGVWKNTSMCVRKCVFARDEFTQEEIVKGRDVSAQSTATQYKIEKFELAMRKGTKSLIVERNNKYYANISEEIDIYCPEGYAPFTSETTVMQNANLSNNSFSTKCLTETTPQKNKWSVLMACYNGFKPCNNSEVQVQSGGIKICNNIGNCFNEFGGAKKFANGKTPHGGKLEMNCSEPWYKHFDYTSPTCKDGTWVSKKRGISPKIAYCEAAYCEADNEILGYAWSKQDLRPGNVIAEKNKRVYYGQNYQFQCHNTNRIGGKEGKVFKCNFSPQDEISVAEVQQDNWFNRYCLSDTMCRNYTEQVPKTRTVQKCDWISEKGNDHWDCYDTQETYYEPESRQYPQPWMDDGEYNIQMESQFAIHNHFEHTLFWKDFTDVDLACRRYTKYKMCSNGNITETPLQEYTSIWHKFWDHGDHNVNITPDEYRTNILNCLHKNAPNKPQETYGWVYNDLNYEQKYSEGDHYWSHNMGDVNIYRMDQNVGKREDYKYERSQINGIDMKLVKQDTQSGQFYIETSNTIR